MPIKISNNFNKDKIIEIYNNNTYVIECGRGYAHNKGWYLKKPSDLGEPVENISLPKALETMKWDNTNDLYKCVISYYNNLASDVHSDLMKDLDSTDKKEIYYRLRIGYSLDFLINFYALDIVDVKAFLRRAFTSYKFLLNYYRNNYNLSLNINKYLEPFKDIMDYLEEDKDELNSIRNYELFTETPNDYNHIILCYDIMEGKTVLQTFIATKGYIWSDTYPIELADNYYYPLAFISIENMWKIFSKGNHKLMDCVSSILEEISYLAGHDGDSPLFYICNSQCLEDVQEDTDLKEDDKELLITLKKSFDEIQSDYRNGAKEDDSKYSSFVETLSKILYKTEYKVGCIKTEIEELDSLIKPLLNRSK